MAQDPQMALPNGPQQDIWTCYELLQINLIVLDDHLVGILQLPLVDKSHIMNV